MWLPAVPQYAAIHEAVETQFPGASDTGAFPRGAPAAGGLAGLRPDRGHGGPGGERGLADVEEVRTRGTAPGGVHARRRPKPAERSNVPVSQRVRFPAAWARTAAGPWR